MASKQWITADIEAERQAIAAELGPLSDEHPDAQLAYLVKRLNELDANEQGVEKLVTLLAILKHNARYRLLSKTEFKRMYEMARYTLLEKKLLTRTSRLSFLAAELSEVESEMAFLDGQLVQAVWLAESGAGLSEENFAGQLMRARSLARLGHISAAVPLYQSLLQHKQADQSAVIWELMRALRVAGRLDEAIGIYEQHKEEFGHQIWFPLTCGLQKNQDYGHFVRLLRPTGVQALDQLFGKAWVYAGGKRSLYHDLPTVEAIRRRLSKAELVRFGAFVEALRQLELAYQDGQSLHGRIAEAGKVLDHLTQMPTCEEELLVLAATLRFLLKFRQYSHARFVLNEYQSLSLKLSEATSKDCLNILGDVQLDTIVEKAQGNRSVAVAAIKALTKGAVVVTGSRLRALTADESETERLRQNEMERLSEVLAEAFGSLKGGMMKVGQILSLFSEMSPLFKNPLRRLQFDAQPSPEKDINDVFASEFGKLPEDVFLEWEREPVALGSIGQVYYAKLPDQRPVAVKIQHKDIERSLHKDLRLLALVKPVVKRMFPASNVNAIVNEIKENLLMEVDYVLEADNQAKIRRHFINDPDIIIPEVMTEFSRERVLTCEYVSGIPYDAFCKTASKAARDRAGQTIARVFYECAFELKLFNCDPHPNNYLFMEDGRVILLDFGCIKTWGQDFVNGLRRFTHTVVANDADDHLQTYIQLGYFKPGDPIDAVACLKVGKIFAEPILEDKEFTITQEFVQRSAEAMYLSNSKLKRYLNPPVDSVMLVRFTFGLLTMLAEMNVTANWHRIFLDLEHRKGIQVGKKTAL